MKKRSSRAGDLRNRERRFSERQVARSDDEDNLATGEGRSVRLPLGDETDEAVAEEIEGNALADGIARIADALAPHLRVILLAAVGALLAVVAWMWMNQQKAALEAASWNEYLAAIQPMDAGALAEVATRNPGTPAGSWARLIQAEMSLDEGTQLLFVDRAQATPKLQAAADMYGELFAGRPSGLLAERATFGLAKANESLGRIAEARAGYEAVVADHADGVLAAPARQRLASLAAEGSQGWYEWFAAQKMTPPAPVDNSPILGLPGDGLPPAAGPSGSSGDIAPATEPTGNTEPPGAAAAAEPAAAAETAADPAVGAGGAQPPQE